MKTNKNWKTIVIIALLIFILTSVFLMFRDKFNLPKEGSSRDYSILPEATSTTGEIKKGYIVEEKFICNSDSISSIGIVFARAYSVDEASIKIELLEGNNVVANGDFVVSGIADQHRTFLNVNPALSGIEGKEYTLRISSPQSDSGLKIMMSDKLGSGFSFGIKKYNGTLCFEVNE